MLMQDVLYGGGLEVAAGDTKVALFANPFNVGVGARVRLRKPNADRRHTSSLRRSNHERWRSSSARGARWRGRVDME
jgi:hypothetical protein